MTLIISQKHLNDPLILFLIQYLMYILQKKKNEETEILQI